MALENVVHHQEVSKLEFKLIQKLKSDLINLRRRKELSHLTIYQAVQSENAFRLDFKEITQR